MTDLIHQLETAAEGSRNLDAMIHWQVTQGVGCGMAQHAPHYTTSLDAAMQLVPEGWGEGRAAWVPGEWWFTLSRSHPTNQEASGTGATPALALCAAALKAREVERDAAMRELLSQDSDLL